MLNETSNVRGNNSANCLANVKLARWEHSRQGSQILREVLAFTWVAVSWRFDSLVVVIDASSSLFVWGASEFGGA